MNKIFGLKFDLLILSLFVSVSIFVISPKQVEAATYYVDSSIADAHVSSATPDCTTYNPTTYSCSGGSTSAYKTIADVNAKSYSAGDNILFKRGDSFYGSINPSSSGTATSPITFSSYGTGDQPVITGFTTIPDSDWKNLGNNIWESTNAVSNLSAVSMVSVNGINTEMGRYPNANATNSGYLTFQSHSGSTSITSSALTGTPNWTGAEVVIRTNHYVLDRSVISSQSGGQLTFTTPTMYEVANPGGFFIQNDPRTLDTQNEWYYNPSTHKLQIYSTSTPLNVKVASLDYLFKANTNYITVDGLDLAGSNGSNIIGSGTHTTIKNSNVSFSGANHLDTSGDYYTAIDNTFTSANNNAISIGGSHSIISRNTVLNTGLFKGMGLTKGYGINSAVSFGGAGTSDYDVEGNKVINSGMNGITFYAASSVLVKNNFVDTYCSILDDGAGIYTYTGSRAAMNGIKIDGNIVVNGIGAPNIVGDSFPTIAAGIYLDNESKNVEVSNNSVANTTEVGIFLNINGNINVHDNTVYNSSTTQERVNWSTNVTNNNNMFISKAANQSTIFVSDGSDLISSWYTGDNNYYARPIDDNKIFNAQFEQGGSWYKSLADWKTSYNKDINSHKSPTAVSSVNDLQFEYNTSTSNKTVALSQPMIDVKGIKYSNSVTLLPYTSVVLMKDTNPGTVTTDTTKPVITAFSIPTTATSLTVSVSSLTATDNVGVTGYLLSETSTAPSAASGPWTSVYPTSYTFSTSGVKTLYAWAKDAAGNVSNSLSKSITITLSDTTPPVISVFSVPATSSSLSVSGITLSASDTVGVTGDMLTESSSTPLSSSSSWTTTAPTAYIFATAGAKTLYAWAKDAAGNVSSPVSRSTTISLLDTTAPVVTSFTIPATSSSLTVNFIDLAAADAVGVTGYKVTESSTSPRASDAGWSMSVSSYTFSTIGVKTLYAWAKDAAGNVSNGDPATVTIPSSDITAPVISTFTIPTTSTSLLISGINLYATDAIGVNGYLISESSTIPSLTSSSWASIAPTSYIFTTPGTKTLYAWAKDAAGNISAPISKSITVSLPDTIAPFISAFSIPTTSTLLTVPITTFNATDALGITGYLLTETSTLPSLTSSSWTSTAPTAYIFATAGAKTLYAWAKDAAGNVSTSVSASTTISLLDTTAPVISSFTVPTISTSLSISGITLIATDTVGVTGYLLTETSATPSAVSGSWAPSVTSYNFTTSGTKTLYAWAKDAAGNISTSSSKSISVTLADTSAPVISAITIGGVGFSTSSVNIQWKTDQASTSQIEYGLTTNYGSSTTLNSTMTSSHSVNITGLKRSTVYHYRVKSTNSNSNLSQSGDYNFKTGFRLIRTPGVATLVATSGSVNLAWSTPLDNEGNPYELYTGAIIMRSTTDFIQMADPKNAIANVKYPTMSYHDEDVTNGVKYYYSVFAYDDLGVYSEPQFISFTPTSKIASSGGGNIVTSSGGGSPSGGGSSSGSGSSSQVVVNPSVTIANTTQAPALTQVVTTPVGPLYKFMTKLFLGSKGSEVKELQNVLINKGYLLDVADGSFGKQTLSAVKKFQKENNLTSDGIIGTQSIEILNNTNVSSSPTIEVNSLMLPVLKTVRFHSPFNDKEEVKKLQQILISKGYLTGLADGSYGQATLVAVMKLQADNGLTQDGVVGAGTRVILNK